MTILFGEAPADSVTERGCVSGQRYGAEYVLQAREGMRTCRSPTLEDVVALVAGDHDRLPAIGGFPQLAEVPLEVGYGRLHANQII